MSNIEEYIYDLTNTLNYDVQIHRCADFAGGSICMELEYEDQKHVMMMNAEQADALSLLLHHAALKLKSKAKEP